MNDLLMKMVIMKTISTSNKRKVKAQRLRFDQFETEPNEPGNKHSRKRGRALRLRGFAVLNYGAGCQCCCDINDMLKYISARASARGAPAQGAAPAYIRTLDRDTQLEQSAATFAYPFINTN